MPNENLQPRLLTIPETAKYLSTTIWQIRSLIWGRELPFLKLGKKYLLDRADIDRFVDRTKSVA